MGTGAGLQRVDERRRVHILGSRRRAEQDGGGDGGGSGDARRVPDGSLHGSVLLLGGIDADETGRA
jgi:hypothetical protein